MPERPNADEILRVVAYIQDGRQLHESTPSDRWFETTNGTENAVPLPTAYEADSYAAGWDTACYAAGNPSVNAFSPDALDTEAYAAGMIAACALVEWDEVPE